MHRKIAAFLIRSFVRLDSRSSLGDMCFGGRSRPWCKRFRRIDDWGRIARH